MSVTLPGETKQTTVTLPITPGMQVTDATFSASFNKVKHKLSDKALQRPTRLKPLPAVSNEDLTKIAKKHQPPAEWFEGETECSF